jgi:thiol-disulfide isomerase/thioredoxin
LKKARNVVLITYMNTKIFLSIICIIIVLGVAGAVIAQKNKTPGKYDSFATCIKNTGTIFYGAFWCPHCQAEKKLFGTSAKLLPYVECSTPDGKDQTPTCKEKGVKSYPTWVFPDLSELTGEVSLATLAEKTSCPLPTE